MASIPKANSFHGLQLLLSSIHSKPNSHPTPKTLNFPIPPSSNSILSSSKSNLSPKSPIIKTIAAGAFILSTLLSARHSLALADPLPSSQTAENSDSVGSLRHLLYQKLEEEDDKEALSILRRLLAAQPEESEWKFLAARLFNEMGQLAESREFLEEILAADPLSFEALFENAVLMDRCGEGDAAVERLERALELARSEQREDAARDVRLIIGQIQYLQRKVEEALLTYDELVRDDPRDYRPYFCQGVIYTMLDRNKEAREKFGKYNELSEKKGEVNVYSQTALSRVKLFGSGDSGI